MANIAKALWGAANVMPIIQNQSIRANHNVVPDVHIRDQWQKASTAARTRNVAGVLHLYFTRVDQHFAATHPHLDFKLVSSALYGTGKIWQSAQQNTEFEHEEQLI